MRGVVAQHGFREGWTWSPWKIRERYLLFAKNGRLRIKEFRSSPIMPHLDSIDICKLPRHHRIYQNMESEIELENGPLEYLWAPLKLQNFAWNTVARIKRCTEASNQRPAWNEDIFGDHCSSILICLWPCVIENWQAFAMVAVKLVYLSKFVHV